MPVRFDASARKAIDLAMTEAERRGHPTLDSAHLLLGVLEGTGQAPAILTSLGVALDKIRADARARAGSLAAPDDRDAAAVADVTEEILQRASEVAAERGNPSVADVDVLLAAAELEHTLAGRVLAHAGVAAQQIRDTVRSATEAAPRPAPAVTATPAGAVTRVGIGYDSHRFATGGPLVLGGISITEDVHLAGHSDGDAIAHALTDAILGAAGAGDIGEMFSDQDPANAGRDSLDMLRAAVARVRALGLRVQQVDVTVVAERPKIAPHRDRMRAALAGALGITAAEVGLKGKTNEGLGWIGRGEGVACMAVATLVGAGA